jgi:hypothetical protein
MRLHSRGQDQRGKAFECMLKGEFYHLRAIFTFGEVNNFAPKPKPLQLTPSYFSFLKGPQNLIEKVAYQ